MIKGETFFKSFIPSFSNLFKLIYELNNRNKFNIEVPCYISRFLDNAIRKPNQKPVYHLFYSNIYYNLTKHVPSTFKLIFLVKNFDFHTYYLRPINKFSKFNYIYSCFDPFYSNKFTDYRNTRFEFKISSKNIRKYNGFFYFEVCS